MAIIGDAYIEIHALTIGFKREVEDALKDVKPTLNRLGEDGGRSFDDGVSRGLKKSGKSFEAFKRECIQASRTLNGLIKKGYAVGPAISGIVSALGDLVFGLGAMVAAIGAATPALAVLGSSLVAVAQAGIVAKIAFGGVAKAISAANKGTKDGAKNTKDLEDARRRLALAYQRADDAMAAANKKVTEAQLNLNAAYKKGAESLQQLGFDSEDAALSQQKAAIELERARETLMRSQDLSPDDRQRREAELAFKEAELNYRKVTDRVNDLKVQQEYAAKTGIEGTEEVISAKKELAQAEADRAKTERDNAQDIAEAQRAMQNSGKNSTNALNNAMKDLSKEAQHFVKFIADLKPKFLELRAAAGKELFGQLETAIKNLVDNLFPVLKPILQETGRVIGEIAIIISKVFTNAKNLDVLKRVFGGTNLTVIKNFGQAIANILDVFFRVLDALSPLTIKFSEWIVTVTEGWKQTLNAKDGVSNLTDTFNKAGEYAARLGKVISQTFGGLKAFFAPAVEAGMKIFEAFGKSMEGLKKFSIESNKTGAMSQKFNAISDNVIAIGGALGDVIKLLWDLAGNPGVKVFADGIRPAIKIAGEIMKSLAGPEIAKVMADFVVKLARVIQLFTEGGGIVNFFKTLNYGLDIVIKIFSNEIVQKIFLFIAAIHGVTLAIGTMVNITKFLGEAMLGKFFALQNAFYKVRDAAGVAKLGMLRFKDGLSQAGAGASAFSTPATQMGGALRGLATGDVALLKGSLSGLNASFMGVAGVSLGVVAAIVAVVAILVLAYMKSEKLREAFSKMVDFLKVQFQKAWQDVQKALGDVGIKVGSLSDLFKRLGDFIAQYVVPVLQVALGGIVRWIGGLVAGVVRIVGGLANLVKGWVNIFRAVWSLMRGDWNGFREYLQKGVRQFVAYFAKIIVGLATPFISVWNYLSEIWNEKIAGMKITIPDWVPVIGGNKLQLPKLPQVDASKLIKRITPLSQGGIVSPTSGGVHALIAEAGRPERVEPLDPDGLSKRDKAMIEFLTSGKSSGHTFNIYPSEGMDETALAAMLSRKVAWTMKRGV